MKCIENRAYNNYLHELLEDGGSWLCVEDDDVYFCGFIDDIGDDESNVSVYGCSFSEAIDGYIELYEGINDNGENVVYFDDNDLKNFNFCINKLEEQLNKLKSLKFERYS